MAHPTTEMTNEMTTNMTTDDLLQRIVRGRRGHHKLYVGMAAGVGKTYRALHDIRDLLERNIDACVGILETHGRQDTEAAAAGLPILPRRSVTYKGVILTELDVAAVLARKPDVVLIDELAHTNVPGSDNRKRFADVEVLLAAGINVISTMNVQHIESVNDLVAQLTGVRVRERVPDRILQEADEVILVDISPELLRERLEAGKIYPADKIQQSLSNFFTLENLAILRELALRLVADAVDSTRNSAHDAIKARIAVAITPTPNATRLVRRGARLAQRLGGSLWVVYIQDRPLSRDQERILDTHRVITESLEGQFVRLEATDAAASLIAFIQRESINQIVMGASLRGRWHELWHGSIVNRILHATTGVDVYVIGKIKQ